MAESKSCSRNSIDYDEYLAGGIPDALLEGLGFYASCDDVEMTSAADHMSDEKPKPETITEPQSLTVKPSTSTGLTDSLPTRRRRGRPPKWPSGHVGGRSAGMSSVHHVSSTRSTNSMQFSSSGSGDLASKTIVKGNIMYRKTETGEVIASVIKNGPKPAASISTAMSTIRGRPPSEPHVTGSLSLSAAGESSLPADCPVNEDNVERILNESITATQSVRRTLVSLKDDLRRMAGGTVMSPTLSPIHLQHRINIAYKLARAFADYRSTVSTISSSTVASAHPETERPAVCAATQSPQHSTAVATLSPQNTASSTTTTQTVLKPTCSEVKNVSDDLLMSCEPGQD